MIFYKNIKIADLGFVINLPERIDRKETTTNLLNDIGISGYSYFNGIKNSDDEWKKYGCTQSFLEIFEIALNKNVESLIIFEDDIKLTKSITNIDIDNIFSNWYSATKNYDIIALGTRPVIGSKVIQDSNYFGKTTNCLCAHAFYYNKNFIKYFYEKMKNYKVIGDPYYRCIVDEFINDCCSHEHMIKNKNELFNVGITIPMMFTQRHSYSDNENCDQNLEDWIDFCFWKALKKE